MTSRDTTGHKASDSDSIELWLVSAGPDRRPGSPLNVPTIPASNFVLGDAVRTLATTARRAGRPWKRSSAASKVAFRSPSPPAWRGSRRFSINSPRARSWPYRTTATKGVAGLAKAGQSCGRWTVHRAAVTDTARRVELCGMADLIWLESPSNPLLTVGAWTPCAPPSGSMARSWPWTTPSLRPSISVTAAAVRDSESVEQFRRSDGYR
jgi:cystathionine gamma-synthase